MTMFADFAASKWNRQRYCTAPSVIMVARPWTLDSRSGKSEMDRGPPGPTGGGIRDGEIFQRPGAYRHRDRWQATA